MYRLPNGGWNHNKLQINTRDLMTLYKPLACDWSARAVISAALYSVFTAATSSGEAEGLVSQLDSIGHPGDQYYQVST
jgi:hypothetical protein